MLKSLPKLATGNDSDNKDKNESESGIKRLEVKILEEKVKVTITSSAWMILANLPELATPHNSNDKDENESGMTKVKVKF